MSDYKPIDCELYSHCELAIIRRQRLRVAWHALDGSIHLEALMPLDLQTRNHAEYMLARNSNGSILKLRLDCIIRIEAR